MYATHSDDNGLNGQGPEPAPVPISALVCNDGGGDDDEQEDGVSAIFHAATRSFDVVQEAAAKFILKTKETHRLMQTVMNSVIQDTTTFMQVMLGDLHYATTEKLAAAGVDPQIIGSLAPLFQDSGRFGQPFRGLETTYRQMKYFRLHFRFIVSVCVHIYIQVKLKYC